MYDNDKIILSAQWGLKGSYRIITSMTTALEIATKCRKMYMKERYRYIEVPDTGFCQGPTLSCIQGLLRDSLT